MARQPSTLRLSYVNLIVLAFLLAILQPPSGVARAMPFFFPRHPVDMCPHCGPGPLEPMPGCLAQGPYRADNGTCVCGCEMCYHDAPPCPDFKPETCLELEASPRIHPSDSWQCCLACKRFSNASNIPAEAPKQQEPLTRAERCSNVTCHADPLCVDYEKASVGFEGDCCPRCLLRLEPRPEVQDLCWNVGCHPDPTCTRYSQAIGSECCPLCIRRKQRIRNADRHRFDLCANVRCPVGRGCRVLSSWRLHDDAVCACKARCSRNSRRRYVCGSDNETYLSSCDLHRHACLTGEPLFVRHAGRCRGSKNSPQVVAVNENKTAAIPTEASS